MKSFQELLKESDVNDLRARRRLTLKRDLKNMSKEIRAIDKQIQKIEAEIQKLGALGVDLRNALLRSESAMSVRQISNTETPELYMVDVASRSLMDMTRLREELRIKIEWVDHLVKQAK